MVKKLSFSSFALSVAMLLPIMVNASTITDSVSRVSNPSKIVLPKNLSLEKKDFFKQVQFADVETDAEVGKAIGAFGVVSKNDHYADHINPHDLTELPLGIRENKGNVEYGIVVTKAQFTPEYALINVYARIVTPQQGIGGGKKELYFGAEGIKLSYGGKIIGEAKLSLLGNINIPFNKDQWLLTLEGGKINKLNGGNSFNDNTYVTIDCDGVKELSLKGNIQISRNVLVPLGTDGKVLPEKGSFNGVLTTNRVRGDFAVKASDWNDLLVKVNISPFAITSQVAKQDKGYFSFLVNNAQLDLSDLRTDPSVVFPNYYDTQGYLIDGKESWRGLFVQTLAIGLPEEFKTRDKSAGPISFVAQNLIIDTYGVSGQFSAQNVFPLDKGITNAENAWKYSLDKIGIDLAASKIVGANLAGKIQLPVQKDENGNNKLPKYLGYTGAITEEEYLVRVTNESDLDFDIWSAKATIFSGSSIELRVKNHEFLPKATLNGKLEINAGDEGDEAKEATVGFKEIEFQNLVLQTKAPYVSVSYFGAKGEQRLGNFPASISDVFLVADERQASLSFGITVGLQDKGFSASGRLSIDGEIVSVNSTQQWKYKGFGISKLGLHNVDIGVATVSGELEIMKKDPLYGKGFKAFLGAKLNGLKGVEVKVNAAFGYSTFRYWGFEGSVNGLKVPAGAVQLTGFTGGAFYRMIPNTAMTIDPKYSDRALVFTPDSTVGLALRAGVYGNLYDDGVASFMAGFNMSTNANGGLANIGFVGEVYVMNDITAIVPNPMAKLKEKFKDLVKAAKFAEAIKDGKLASYYLDVNKVSDNYPTTANSPATIYGKMVMNYDFNNSVFHATMDVFINSPGGVIKGVGAGGRAGWAVLHLAPKEWYLHIGTPQDMIGLRVGVGSFSVQSGSYFMVGNKIPGSPPPPIEVANILGLDRNDLDYMKDLNALGDGKGFAFGSHFKFDTGDMTALFLYARFSAGLGADIMLKNYGDAACSNRNGKQIGIDGWYANGQAYVYLQGELGIKIKLFFIKKKIPIIKAGAAALLQLKGPNPYWMRGYLGGYYNLLGGMIKGKFRFKLEFGEECKLENESVLGGMKIISDVTPKKDENEVDVFAIPQATFALRVNEPIVIPEDDGDHTYKVVVDKFTIVDDKGTAIKGKIEYASSGDVANFVSEDILPPNKAMKAVVEVSFMENKNGIYEVVFADGKKAVEIEERSFTTGTAPNIIPLSNIQYAYPVVDQENYYTRELDKGYIKLKRGQDYLFEDNKWKTTTQLTDAKGKKLLTDFSYNSSANEINFTVPALDKQMAYNLSLIAKNQNSTASAGNNEVVSTNSTGNDDETTVTMETRTKAAANVAKDGELERMAFNFRTSKYGTLTEKIGALRFTNLWLKVSSDVVSLQNNMNADEYFDATELVGSKYTDNKPLINLTAAMEDVFAAKFKELFYNNYPIDNISLDREGAEDLAIGIPPVNALPIFTSYLTYLDKDKTNPLLKTTFPYQYDLFRYYKTDWYNLVSKASGKYATVDMLARPLVVNKLISSSYGVIPKLNYRINLQYVMPGEKAGTQRQINYELK